MAFDDFEDTGQLRQDLENADFGYAYPEDLDLKPGDETHEKIIKRLRERAKRSFTVMTARHPKWRKLDDLLNAFIEHSDEDVEVKAKDPNKPIAIRIPTTYATLETLLTYFTVVFLSDQTIFRYEGTGVEDTASADKLEAVVAKQCIDNKIALALHTMWRDDLVYGIGPAAVLWEAKKSYQRRVEQEVISTPDGDDITTEEIEEISEVTLSEGNKLMNIDPYRFLPDPTVPIYETQDGEYVGWMSDDNRMNILDRERSNHESYFNAKYLKFTRYDNTFVTDTEREGRYSRTHSHTDVTNLRNNFTERQSNRNSVHITYMYVKLIPDEWGLGDSEFPEKWLFTMGNGSIILQAQPINLDHDMFPVVVSSSSFDGHSLLPLSKMEQLLGLQEAVDFMYNSHIANVRKAINDMLIVDPSLINMNDLRNPKPGKLIRLRRSAWGTGALDRAVKQLNVQDITKNNIGDISYIQSLMQQVSGAVDSLQGIQERSGSRVSASEAGGTRQSALSRLEKMTKIVSIQAHQDIAKLFASQTIQLMTQETYVKMVGTENTFVGNNDREPVSAKDINVQFDVIQHDGSFPALNDAQIWLQMYQIVVSNPELLMKFDVVKIFKYITRNLGAKNVDDFIKMNQQVIPQVQTPEQITNAVAKGEISPIPTT